MLAGNANGGANVWRASSRSNKLWLDGTFLGWCRFVSYCTSGKVMYKMGPLLVGCFITWRLMSSILFARVRWPTSPVAGRGISSRTSIAFYVLRALQLRISRNAVWTFCVCCVEDSRQSTFTHRSRRGARERPPPAEACTTKKGWRRTSF